MSRRGRFLAGVFLVLFLAAILALAWSPWLDDKEIRDRVLSEKAVIDGTMDRETGELICDYSVMWIPFGRWVASCEGGYLVTFYGALLP